MTRHAARLQSLRPHRHKFGGPEFECFVSEVHNVCVQLCMPSITVVLFLAACSKIEDIFSGSQISTG